MYKQKYLNRLAFKSATGILLGSMLLAFFQGCNVMSGFSGSSLPRLDSQVLSSNSDVFTGALLNAQPRLGDRNFVASTLSAVFGNNANVTGIITGEVRSQVVIFGGRCDDNQGDCYGNTEGAYIGALPVASILREARKIRACDRILALPDNAGLNNALSLIYKDQPVGPVDAKNISVAYELFSPGRTLSAKLAADLVASVSDVSESTNQWIAALTALCHDPSWETP
jgi:hypothetical protein